MFNGKRKLHELEERITELERLVQRPSADSNGCPQNMTAELFDEWLNGKRKKDIEKQDLRKKQ